AARARARSSRSERERLGFFLLIARTSLASGAPAVKPGRGGRPAVSRRVAVLADRPVAQERHAHAHLPPAADRVLALLGLHLDLRLQVDEVVGLDLELAAHVQAQGLEDPLDAED